jgi:hypothetical protein
MQGAGAHSAEGILGVEATPAPEARAVMVSATLKYANDNDPAPGATVSVVATDPTGGAIAPVTLRDVGLGGYQGTVDLPAAGTWTLTVTAADPAATATTTVTIEDQAEDPPEPAPTTATPDPNPGGSDGAADDDSTIVIVAAVVIVGVLIAAAAIVLNRRRAH